MGQSGYLYIVNGTPYRWRKSDGHVYQMDAANFPDYIDAFSTYKAYFEFEVPWFGNWFDDEAWAEYTMDGCPSHTFFRLWVNSQKGRASFKLRLTGMTTLTGDGPNNNSDIDLGFRHNAPSHPTFNGTSCIIAGVHGAFVTTSRSTFPKGNSWMARSLATIGDLTLREICLPGTHNSGMSVSRYSTTFGMDKAVLCQFRSVADQLAYGVRCFDIRPIGRGPEFETGHYGNSDAVGWQGASGQTMEEVIDQINAFTKENQELIILNVSHAYDADDGFREFHNRDWGDVFNSQFDRLQNLYYASSPDADLSRIKIKELIQDGNKAAVIVRLGFDRNNEALVKNMEKRLGKGYFWPENLPIFDSYANKNDPNELMDDQFAKLQKERGGKAPADGEVFCIGWALTPGGGDVVFGSFSLLDWARLAMTPRLSVLFDDKTSKACYPNILGMDGVETTDATAMAVAISTRAKF